MYLKSCLILPDIPTGLIKGITSSYKPCLACIMFAESQSWGVIGLKQSPVAEVMQDIVTALDGPPNFSLSFV